MIALINRMWIAWTACHRSWMHRVWDHARMEDATPPKDESEDFMPPLRGVVRWPMGIVGGLTLGTAVVATFRSGNQAGTATLALIGGVLILVAFQGTPLIRMGTSSASIEVAQLKRRVRQVFEKAAEGVQGPEVARGMAEAAAEIDPELRKDPAVRGRIYETQVEAALARAASSYPAWGVSKADVDAAADFVVGLGKETYVNVVAKYLTMGPIRLRDVRTEQSALPTLVLTNAPLSGEVQEHNADVSPTVDGQVRVEFVTWNDEKDDGILARALARLAAAAR